MQHTVLTLPLVGFEQLQTRYLSLGWAKRASQLLSDAEPALAMLENILQTMESHQHFQGAISNIRKNPLISGRLRASEAKTQLLDSTCDLIGIIRHKAAAWRKTIERISQGEGIVQHAGKETIAADSAMAMAILGNTGISSYLSMLQLVLQEMQKLDLADNQSHYMSVIAGMRRCSTILGDCEDASGLTKIIH